MRTILLAGGPADREPGCPLGLPRPLWPMTMRPLVLRLIERLVRGGATALSVCANGQTGLYAARLTREPLGLDELCFVQDPLPRGPAGCVKDNEAFVQADTFVVIDAACWMDEDVASLVRRHRQQHNKLTVFCVPQTNAPSGVYVFEPEVLEHIPALGYCDIKEQLIPRLIDEGLRVGALPLHGHTGEVLNVETYLTLHRQLLLHDLQSEIQSCPGQYCQLSPDVWVAADAEIGRNVRIFGPAIVGPRTNIRDGAVIIGPSSLGAGVVVGDDAIITECAIWDDANVPRGVCLDRTVVVPNDGLIAGHRKNTGSRRQNPARLEISTYV